MSLPVLIILPHNPGDVVMALQALERLKARYPDLEIDYLAGEESGDLVRGSPLLRRVILLPRRALKEAWNAGDASAVGDCLEAFLLDLASVRYALSANLFQERSGGLIQAMVRADRKIGLELSDNRNFQVKSRFLEHLSAVPARRSGNAWHVIDIYVRALSRALEGMGAAPASRPAPETPGRRRAGQAAALFPPLLRPEACAALIPGAYLAFHPGSAWAGKRWPETQWALLAGLCARAGFAIAFTGAPEERPVMERILAAMDADARAAAVDCVGATSLSGAAWVHAHARRTVTGDTVAMHLAAACGTPTLSLFGASNPVETGPHGNGHFVIQTDPDPPPDLDFGNPHPGLARLGAQAVAGFLLEGIPPPDFAVWETAWDPDLGMQVLRDPRRRPHPCLENALGLLGALDREADRAQPATGTGPMIAGPGPRRDLRRALEACLAGPGAENLGALAKAEEALAAETQADLVWEAYRIAVNGISPADLRAHLEARLARFDLALREETLAAGR